MGLGILAAVYFGLYLIAALVQKFAFGREDLLISAGISFLVFVLFSLIFTFSVHLVETEKIKIRSDKLVAESKGRNEEMKRLNDLLIQMPSDPALLVQRGRLFAEQHSYDKAVVDLEKAVSIKNDDASVLKDLVYYLSVNGTAEKNERLIKVCTDVLERHTRQSLKLSPVEHTYFSSKLSQALSKKQATPQ